MERLGLMTSTRNLFPKLQALFVAFFRLLTPVSILSQQVSQGMKRLGLDAIITNVLTNLDSFSIITFYPFSLPVIP